MGQPTSAVTRWEYSATFHEFDGDMNRRGYIGTKVLRPRMVGTQAASFGKVTIEQLLQQRETARQARAGYGRSNWDFSNDSYATEEHGWEEPMDDRELRMYRDIVDQEGIQAERAMMPVCDKYERAVAAAVFNTSTWTGASLTTAVGTQWTQANWSSATPIKDVLGAIEKVRQGGVMPNALILNYKAFSNMVNCTEVLDRIRYAKEATQSAVRSAIADHLGLRQVIVSGGLTNSANPGQTASISDIWGAYAMVAKVAETDDPKEVCIGRTYMWSEENAPQSGSDGPIAVVMEEYRDDTLRGNIMRARAEYALKVLYPEAGHLLSNIY